MFKGGSIWQPPPINPYAAKTIGTGMTASAALACASSANVHANSNTLPTTGEGSPTLAMKKNFLLEQLLRESNDDNTSKPEKEKKLLSDR